MLPAKMDAEKEDGEIDDSSKKDATRRIVPAPQIQDMSKTADNGRRVANLPQRPGPIPPPLRRQPSREPPRPQQTQQQQLANEPMRANTPRRDENMPVRTATDLVMRPNTIQNTRVIVQQQPGRPQPQHQLPDRPQAQQPQHGRVADRDLRDLVRDSRPQVEIRGRPGAGERLPERPGQQERRQPSPRRDSGGRDIRDPHRRDVERPRGGRDESFQRPALPSRDDRGQRGPERKEPDVIRPDGTPQRQNQPPQQTPPSRSDSRVPTPDLDRTRRGDRVDDRSRRHEQLRQGEPMVIDRLEHLDRRIPERRLSDQTLPRQQQEEPHLQRPPAGPRADVERDRRNRQQVEATGPLTPKERDQRDLFPGAPIRAPSGPSIQDHRDQQRHVAVQPHHQDPNHGRLNPPDLIIPKGPRDRNPPHGPRGGPARPSTGPQTPAAPGMRIPSTPVGGVPPLPSPNEKLMITLPAEKPEQKQSLSTPSTPGVDTTGIHPDRLRAMGVSEGPGPKQLAMNSTPRGESRPEARERGEQREARQDRPQPQPQPENRQQTLPVHPSRMGSIQTSSSSSSTPGTSTPPSGPRGGPMPVEKLPVGPPPPSATVPNKPGSPPTGPATSRPDRGDEAHHQRRRMQAMQNLLGQAGDTAAPQGNVIRGRARRGNGTTGNGSTSGREQSSRGSLGAIEIPTGGGSGRRSVVAVDGRRSSTSLIAAAELPLPSPRSLSGPGSTEDRGGSEGSRSGRHGRERDGREGRGEGRDRDVRERERERGGERERERDRGGERDRDVLRDRDVIRERDRETRERHPDRDRGIERERDRERERVERERVETRRDSERGGSSTDRKDRERGEREPRGVEREPRGAEPRDRGDRERDVRERERERERDRERRDRKHGREDSGAGARGDGGRKEEPKRRRRGGDNWGAA